LLFFIVKKHAFTIRKSRANLKLILPNMNWETIVRKYSNMVVVDLINAFEFQRA